MVVLWNNETLRKSMNNGAILREAFGILIASIRDNYEQSRSSMRRDEKL